MSLHRSELCIIVSGSLSSPLTCLEKSTSSTPLTLHTGSCSITYQNHNIKPQACGDVREVCRFRGVLSRLVQSVIAIDKHGKQQYHALIGCRVTAFLRKMFHDCDGIDFISDFEGVSVTCSSPRINQAKESEMNCTFKRGL